MTKPILVVLIVHKKHNKEAMVKEALGKIMGEESPAEKLEHSPGLWLGGATMVAHPFHILAYSTGLRQTHAASVMLCLRILLSKYIILVARFAGALQQGLLMRLPVQEYFPAGQLFGASSSSSSGR